MRRFALLVLITVAPAAAAPVPKGVKKKDDVRAVLGKWEGGLGGAAKGGGYVFRFGDDGTCGITNVGPNNRESGAAYELHPDKSPRQMTWWNGAERTEWRCVYELDGDTLKVVFVHAGTDIPPDAAPRAGVTVYELKRMADDK
ncbi:MAG: hypothetical protein ABGY75_18430 [Gemmataceae bacterium]